MNWIVLAGEIYHGRCKHWTLLTDPIDHCAGCGDPIPEEVVRLSKELLKTPETR